MPGPLPNERRRRRNADVLAGHESSAVNDGKIVGPALEGQWSDHARAYWDTWRRAPMAKLFLDTDWMRLRLLIVLVEDYLKKPTAMKLAEIRQNETLLGATHADRVRARIKILQAAAADGPEEMPAGVTAIDEYRRALSG